MIKRILDRLLTREILLYVFFGVCTMVLNMIAYGVLYRGLHLSNVFSTAAAWFLAALGAYISNRIWVFESRARGFLPILREIAMFFSCRIATGAMDIFIMYISVDVLNLNEMLFKLISNILVVISNYAASKLFIFKK